MSLVISTNISALNTTNQLNRNTNLMNSSLQKLSSGYAINSAADNAAGLAISEKMRSQIQGLDQASSNSQDAISLTQTADGALDETTSILKRMRELAVQASSDTLTDDDRTSIQDEVDQLRQELDRISNDTEYNTKKLLNGDSGSTTAVSGTNSAAIISSTTTAGNNTKTGDYVVNYTAVATQGETGKDITSATGITTSAASASAFAGSISINGTTITIENGDTIEGVLDKINAETTTTGVTATLDSTDTSNQFIKLTASTYGSDSEITLAADNATLRGLFNATSSATATSVTVNGTDAAGTINGAIATAHGNTLKAFDLTVTGNDEALAVFGDDQEDVANALDKLVTTMAASTGTTMAADDHAAATAYTTALTGGNSASINAAKQVLITEAGNSDDTGVTSALATYNTAYTAETTAIPSIATNQTAVGTALSALVTAMGSGTTAESAAATAYTTADGNLTSGTSGSVTAYNTALSTLLTTAAASSDKTITDALATYKAATITAEDTPLATATVSVDASSALTFQVGANSKQTMTLSISDMDADALGVAGNTSTTGIDLSTAENATNAISTLDKAIKKVSAERSGVCQDSCH